MWIWMLSAWIMSMLHWIHWDMNAIFNKWKLHKWTWICTLIAFLRRMCCATMFALLIIRPSHATILCNCIRFSTLMCYINSMTLSLAQNSYCECIYQFYCNVCTNVCIKTHNRKQRFQCVVCVVCVFCLNFGRKKMLAASIFFHQIEFHLCRSLDTDGMEKIC